MYQSASDSMPSSASPEANDLHQGSRPDLSAPTRGFLVELTHAMQATAERQRETTAAEVDALTAAHLDHVKTRAAAEAEELRRMAQGDIDGIHSWHQAESARLQEEAERRILARGQELDSYLVRHAAIIDGEVDEIEAAVVEYRTRLDGYFDRLTTESSPAEIARLADEIPEPPDLAKVGGEARAKAVAAVAAEAEGATAAGGERELVPVMAPAGEAAAEAAPPAAPADAASANGSANGSNATNGTNGTNGTASDASAEHANPAVRFLRSIATLAAPAEHPAEAPKAAEPEDAAKV